MRLGENVMRHQNDWIQREEICDYVDNIKKIVDFLNKFETTAISKMAKIKAKLAELEGQMDLMEHMVATVTGDAQGAFLIIKSDSR
jgi:hypothetical protein